jgi:hypothetical protein
MSDTVTTNYAFTKPEVGASSNTWGTKLNANWDALDALLSGIETDVAACLAKAGGTMTGDLTMSGGVILAAPGSVSAPGLSWSGDANTGWRWVSANKMAAVANGADVFEVLAGQANYISTDLGSMEVGTRRLKRVATSGPFTLTAAMANTCQSGTGDVTVPASVFAAGDCVAIFNRSTLDANLFEGSGLTMYLNGTGTHGDLLMAPNTMVSIWFDSATVCTVMGAKAS